MSGFNRNSHCLDEMLGALGFASGFRSLATVCQSIAKSCYPAQSRMGESSCYAWQGFFNAAEYTYMELAWCGGGTLEAWCASHQGVRLAQLSTMSSKRIESIEAWSELQMSSRT
eukprot:1175330-Amphidinium_carterae.1